MTEPTFEKERIIKEGTLKERSLLYLTHFAYTETELDLPPLIKQTDKGPKYIGPDVLLTAEEVDELYEKINFDPNKKRYDELRKLYTNWTYYKEQLSKEVLSIHSLGAYLLLTIAPTTTYKTLNEVANILIRANEETKEKLSKLRLRLTLNDDLKAEIGPTPDLVNEVASITIEINEKTEVAKCYIHNLRLITKSRLPLIPFKDWLKKEEEVLTKTLNHIIRNSAPFIDEYKAGSILPDIKLKSYQETPYDFKDSDLEGIINTEL